MSTHSINYLKIVPLMIFIIGSLIALITALNVFPQKEGGHGSGQEGRQTHPNVEKKSIANRNRNPREGGSLGGFDDNLEMNQTWGRYVESISNLHFPTGEDQLESVIREELHQASKFPYTERESLLGSLVDRFIEVFSETGDYRQLASALVTYEKVVEEFDEQLGSDSIALRGLATSFLSRSTPEPHELREGIDIISSRRSEQDSELLFEIEACLYAKMIELEGYNLENLHSMTSNFELQENPEKVINRSVELAIEHARDGAFYSQRDVSDSFVEFATSVIRNTDIQPREEYLDTIINILFESSIDATADAVFESPSGPKRDLLILSMVKRMNRSDTIAANQWVDEISSPDLREEALSDFQKSPPGKIGVLTEKSRQAPRSPKNEKDNSVSPWR